MNYCRQMIQSMDRSQGRNFIFYWLVSLSLVSLVSSILDLESGVSIPDVWSFHIPWHALAYQDFGFVKRELLGTLLSPFRPTGDLKLFSLLVYLSFSAVFYGCNILVSGFSQVSKISMHFIFAFTVYLRSLWI